jgi:hypothetical protein
VSSSSEAIAAQLLSGGGEPGRAGRYEKPARPGEPPRQATAKSPTSGTGSRAGHRGSRRCRRKPKECSTNYTLIGGSQCVRGRPLRVARDEYTPRLEVAVCHWFNPSTAHSLSCENVNLTQLSRRFRDVRHIATWPAAVTRRPSAPVVETAKGYSFVQYCAKLSS